MTRQGTARAPKGPDFADIKAGLLQPSRLLSLVQHLCPGGHKNGIYWTGFKNPTRMDRHGGSMWVIIEGASAGVWKDEAEGADGDVIELIAYVMGYSDHKRTREFCLKFLGQDVLTPQSDEDRARRDERRRKEHEATEKEAAEKLAANRKNGFGLWLNGIKEISGTPVDTYLKSRAIDLSLIGRQPGAIRYLPNHKHIGQDNELTYWPCMGVSMMTPLGSFGAIHRTYLAEDGSGKAPVEPARKIWPSFKGCVARLSKGKSGLSPEEAAKQGVSGPVILCEGIEDGLSLVIACPDYRVWVTGSIANIAHVPALPCVSSWVICADNDPEDSRAAAQLTTALQGIHQHGLPWVLARSDIGKDVNDLLRGKEG